MKPCTLARSLALLALLCSAAPAQKGGKIQPPRLGTRPLLTTAGGKPIAGAASADPWWQAHGGALRIGAPDKPAVLLVHGLHQSAQDFLKPSVVGFNYDVHRAPPDRDLGTSDTAGVGIESLGVSALAEVDQNNWFDYLSGQGCTVAAWNLPSNDVFQALGSAVDALAHLQQAAHALNPSAPPPIALIGHSMGGLVIRALLKEKGNPGGEIRWVITLCSPHQGSELAAAPQKLEDDAAAWAASVSLPPQLSAPVADVARQVVHGLIDMFAPPLDPASKALAPNSALLQALAAGETALPGVRYDTFAGVDPNYLRVYAWVFDAESALPQISGASIYFKWTVHANEITPVSPLLARLPHEFPEITPWKGDGLVAAARAHLPWSIRHTWPINHAQALWDRSLQEEVAEILLGERAVTRRPTDLAAGLNSGADELDHVIDLANAAKDKASKAVAALFEIVPDAALKGRLGHLVLDFPAGAKFDDTHIEVFDPPADGATGKGERVGEGYGSKTLELMPGNYDVWVSNARVAAVELRSKYATRVSLGGLHVAVGAQTSVELYDAEGKTRLTDFYGEKTIGLPIGKYQVRIAKKSEPVEVQAGAITEF